MGIRAMAWVHFATSAKHVTSHQQAGAEADALMTEFDKRFPQYKEEEEAYAAADRARQQPGKSQAELEAELDVVNKAQELEKVLEVVAEVAQPGETVVDVVSRLVKATL